MLKVKMRLRQLWQEMTATPWRVLSLNYTMTVVFVAIYVSLSGGHAVLSQDWFGMVIAWSVLALALVTVPIMALLAILDAPKRYRR